MTLHKDNLYYIKPSVPVSIPQPSIFDLPEKVLQFGTGVLLRGLPDYFIDKANRKGIFNGRVVVVKSTGKGTTTAFDEQDALYTICTRGIENEHKVEENIVCSSISRVLNAQSQWTEILAVAASPAVRIVISNTTENGIEYLAENIKLHTPVSFPGKLLAVLYHRYQVFEGDPDRGLVIIPTELISDNASRLKEIIFKLTTHNKLETSFLNWLADSNTFCNTLVDRIVPGKPDLENLQSLEQSLGYKDELLICTEVYKLWAIEGDQHVREVLSFEQADDGLIVTPDITLFKELKLRLLNGTHTLGCAVACLSGFQTVFDSMRDPDFATFARKLMQEDLAPAIPHPVPLDEAISFSEKVLDRFRNPHIKHHWLSISTNYTTKLKMRVIPVLQVYLDRFGQVPEHLALGFAAYLLLMKGEHCKIDDEHAPYFEHLWTVCCPDELVQVVLSNNSIWEVDLSSLPGFTESVTGYLNQICKQGIRSVLQQGISYNRTIAQ